MKDNILEFPNIVESFTDDEKEIFEKTYQIINNFYYLMLKYNCNKYVRGVGSGIAFIKHEYSDEDILNALRVLSSFFATCQLELE